MTSSSFLSPLSRKDTPSNMFGDQEDTHQRMIELLLDQFTLEEILEELNLGPEEVLLILFNGGYGEPPPWMERLQDDF